jgi:hypothetical protein
MLLGKQGDQPATKYKTKLSKGLRQIEGTNEGSRFSLQSINRYIWLVKLLMHPYYKLTTPVIFCNNQNFQKITLVLFQTSWSKPSWSTKSNVTDIKKKTAGGWALGSLWAFQGKWTHPGNRFCWRSAEKISHEIQLMHHIFSRKEGPPCKHFGKYTSYAPNINCGSILQKQTLSSVQ